MKTYEFKLGNRVRCVDANFRHCGLIGTVTDIYPPNPEVGALVAYRVEFDDGSGLDADGSAFEPAVIGSIIEDGGSAWQILAALPA